MAEIPVRRARPVLPLALAFAALLHAAGGAAAAGKMLFVDPFPAAEIHENRTDMLIAWNSSRIRNATLVNIATNSGFYDPAGIIPSIERIRSLLEEGRLDEFRRLGSPLPLRENLLTPDNFVQAAYRLGIVKEMVWIVPRSRSITEENFRDLKRHYIDDVDRSTGESLQFRNGIIEGEFSGMPVRICTMLQVGDMEISPAIVSIDMDFFSSLYENPMKRSLLGILSETVSLLKAAGIPCRFAGLTASFFGGHAPLLHAFLGDALLSLVRDPDLFTKELDPRWSAINEALRLEALGDIDGALKLMWQLSDKYQDYAYPYYFAATLFFRRQDEERLLYFLDEARSRDHSYLRGYVEIAVWAERTEREGTGLLLLEEAHDRDAESPLVLYLLGNRARSRGKCDEAAEYYERFTAVAGRFAEILEIIEECRR